MNAGPVDNGGAASLTGRNLPVNEANEGGIGAVSANTSSVNKVSVMHGVILLSGIELALTVGNAVNQDAFELKCFSDLIFGGSVVIEAVGFMFAIGMAVRVLRNPFVQNVVGEGVPAMVIVERLALAESDRDFDGLYGLGIQWLSFLGYAMTSWVVSPESRPTYLVLCFVLMPLVCMTLICVAFWYALWGRLLVGSVISPILVMVFVAVPFAVECSESALLFKSDSIPFVSYLLAVLDLIIIAPAAVFIVYMYVVVLVRMKGSTTYAPSRNTHPPPFDFLEGRS